MAHSDTFQDEILYCANCGISFLWAQEEQKRAGEEKAPRLCPGCRLLAPVAPRLRGVVKWYHPRKQYGFIVRKGDAELYVHGSALLAARTLRPGDLVEFCVVQTERGLAAEEVVVLPPATPATA